MTALKGRTIGLLGLAFKPDTDDLRDAPAVDIAQRLIERGCKVKAHDPVALDRFRREHGDIGVFCCDSAEDVLDDADAVVLVTEWPIYRELRLQDAVARMRNPVILDCRGALDRDRVTSSGLKYIPLIG